LVVRRGAPERACLKTLVSTAIRTKAAKIAAKAIQSANWKAGGPYEAEAIWKTMVHHLQVNGPTGPVSPTTPKGHPRHGPVVAAAGASARCRLTSVFSMALYPEVEMPDSFGKRNRDRVKAEKAAARDARRAARNLRQEQRQAGTWEPPAPEDESPETEEYPAEKADTD
jgi:hypothetical protein